MTTMMCKKHGKPRTVVYNRTMPNGAVFPLVGCEDCRSQQPRNTPPAKKKKPARPAGVRSF